MFDIGFLELLLLGVVGLLVLGPERLPTAARTLGLWLGKIKRTVAGMQREISAQLEAEELRQKLKEQQDKLKEQQQKFDESVRQATRDVERLAEPDAPKGNETEGEQAPPPPEQRLDDALARARRSATADTAPDASDADKDASAR